ncbi:HNH endonuclease [Prosthecomicrobium sp. N25]|uniref:HNH endonuclease n=1 Tax=Prosthecomicrobium sp. N25 TaxID=3129254 RepID=UPI003FCDED49
MSKGSRSGRALCGGCPYPPVGRPHDGPVELGNLLCLCLNHHVLFDHGGIAIGNASSIFGGSWHLIRDWRHPISRDRLAYHRPIWRW